MADLEDTFAEIAEDAIARAEAVDCSLVEYRDGLKTMLAAIRLRYEQVSGEVGGES